MPDALIDTGALLALLDKTDPWHGFCVETFRQLRLPLATSEAVLTELFHLVGEHRHEHRHEREAASRLVRSGAIVRAEINNPELPAIHDLMARYVDSSIRPMDFTDATLVHLARREGLATIFTVDRSDFDTYRIEGCRRFRVLPANRPEHLRRRSGTPRHPAPGLADSECQSFETNNFQTADSARLAKLPAQTHFPDPTPPTQSGHPL